jgi:hypothetical protein
MILVAPADCTQFNASYVLFSPDARLARSEYVSNASPFSDAPTIIRRIEIRQLPFAAALNRIEEFGKLETDWDSYGGAAISPVARLTARTILSDLAMRPATFGATPLVPFSVSAVANGGINLEWRRSDAALELWIGVDGAIDVLLDRHAALPRFEERVLAGIPSAISEVLSFAA